MSWGNGDDDDEDTFKWDAATHWLSLDAMWELIELISGIQQWMPFQQLKASFPDTPHNCALSPFRLGLHLKQMQCCNMGYVGVWPEFQLRQTTLQTIQSKRNSKQFQRRIV